jgi:small subunit ribosomal protein S16
LVKIRLRRMGSAKTPFYRIVAADARKAVSGNFIEILGYYDPLRKPLELKVDEIKVFKWLGHGAQLSDTMKSLLSKSGTMAKWNRILQGEEGVEPEMVFLKGEARNTK